MTTVKYVNIGSSTLYHQACVKHLLIYLSTSHTSYIAASQLSKCYKTIAQNYALCIKHTLCRCCKIKQRHH